MCRFVEEVLEISYLFSGNVEFTEGVFKGSGERGSVGSRVFGRWG